MRKRSFLWDHYQKDNDKEHRWLATCNYCRKKLSYRSALSNLKTHLVHQHSDIMKYPEKQRTYTPGKLKTHLIQQQSDIMKCPEKQPTYTPGIQRRRRRSPLWRYYTIFNTETKTAMCNICNNIKSFKGTITNLKTHLMRHKKVYSQYIQELESDVEKESASFSFTVKGQKLEIVSLNKFHTVENQDEDSNSSMKFSEEIWDQFETEDDNCRCCICREITDNTIEAMRNHLEESHPIVLIKILNKPTNTKSPAPIEECPTEADSPPRQSQNDDTASEMFTEVVYLDEALDTSSAQAVDNSSNEEIDSFLKYVGVLLRNMNKETQSKMQLDILDIILRKRQE